ncbi:Chromatin-remodeling complexes subunit ngg1 [Teratosphaeria destructans]|uniref:Chromatin-remodeling complexes subunit ngg1 n=1 Tax=Teratosphaeria destructans TaxID=418781 RepID=A0A9W7SQ82_9PEZI|nr:Chromatin-remodeling complexes subunit ngg1 [Teratosphaeria destructans]
MAPPSSKKGSTSKNVVRDRRSNSRHSTPVSTLTESPAPPTPLAATPTTSVPAPAPTFPKETAYLKAPTAALTTAADDVSRLIAHTSSRNHDPPTAKELHALHDKIKDTLTKPMARRGEVCDRAMRQLVQRRKERLQVEREQEAERQARDHAAKQERDDGERKKTKKDKAVSRKRSHDEMDLDDDKARERKRESLPDVGAHGLARQDGVGVHEGAPPPPSPPVQPGTAAIDPMDTAESPSDSDAGNVDPPSTIPLYERAFGKDPTKFDDPTVYDIRPIYDDMPAEEKREILQVLHWPEDDLRSLTAGDPPDADFSNAKPANQVNFSTFQTYVEPYIRPYTEEDVAFLKERGDRYTPYVIPARGPKTYKQVWAADEEATGIEPPAKRENDRNEPRGNIEDMNDDTAETDEISLGPVNARLQSLLRPQGNGNTKKKDEDDADANGDTSMVNGDDTTQFDAIPGAEADHRPATYLPSDAPRPANLPPMDYETMEQRVQQELRYIGFLAPSDVPTFDQHNDDEVAARLRTLQAELRRISRLNNARKARVLEMTEERMAMQEYSNIADDLDNQVNAAYLNATAPSRTAEEGAAANRAQKGVAVGAGLGGPGAGGRGVSDGVRALMQKRRDWIEMVGPVVGFGRAGVVGEGETVFDEERMRGFERAEREAEVADGEEGE